MSKDTGINPINEKKQAELDFQIGYFRKMDDEKLVYTYGRICARYEKLVEKMIPTDDVANDMYLARVVILDRMSKRRILKPQKLSQRLNKTGADDE